MQALPARLDEPSVAFAPEPGRPDYRPFRVRVSRVERLTPCFWQVTFTGPDVSEFGTAGLDQRIKLLLPPGHPADWNAPAPLDGAHAVVAGDWYDRWRGLPDADRPPMRTYTVRRVRPADSEVDVVLAEHPVVNDADHGPAGRWLRLVAGGCQSEIIIVGPDARSPDSDSGIDWRPGAASRLLLAGDETAAPAIVAVLEATRTVRVTAFVEVPSRHDVLPADIGPNARVRWLERGAEVHGARLLPAVTAWLDSHDGLLRGARAPEPQVVEDTDVDRDLLWDSPPDAHGGFYAWFAGEAAAVKALRRAVVTDRGVDRRQVAFMGYWRQGQAERQ